MKKVPVVQYSEFQTDRQEGQANQSTILLTGLEVRISKTRPILYLSLSTYAHGLNPESHLQYDLALSPPAEQLSETLDQAVNDYLHSEHLKETK